MTYDPKGRSSQLGGPALRSALSADADAWVTGLWGDGVPGAALCAVGGYGRGHLAPGSDLDLVVVHREGVDPGAAALRVWHGVWDAHLGLDHSVRTVAEAVAMAHEDIKVALGLLDLRFLAGDGAVAAELRTAVVGAWVATGPRRLAASRELFDQRLARHGELAFLLEPDLKESRGGLRDAQLPWAAAMAQIADAPGAAHRAAQTLLLDVRGALHTHAIGLGHRPEDRLGLADQDAVAAAVGVRSADLMAAGLAVAGRTIAREADSTWRVVSAATRGRPVRRLRLPGRSGPVRTPLAAGVVEQDGEVTLALSAELTDPALPLRVARVAATRGLAVTPFTWQRLREETPAPAEPWTAEVREELLAVLGLGTAVVAAVETLDEAGLWERYVPEWPRVRSKPQRNAYHRFTVDRHLLEVVVEAAGLTRDVSRPDLLLLAALLHDIGKGYPGDHTEVGIGLVPDIARRMGLPEADVGVLVTLVAHHLTLADTATRRDLSDPATTQHVADAVGTHEVLVLLRALTEADSIGTGPSMWSTWKAGLLDDLTRRTARVLGGEAPGGGAVLVTPEVEALIASLGEGGLEATSDGVVVMVGTDAPGMLRTFAAVLALHRLDIRAVDLGTSQGRVWAVMATQPRFGGWPEWARVREDLGRALAGSLDPLAEVRERARAYPESPALLLVAPPRVVWIEGASESATVVELRAPDSPALLARASEGLARAGLDVRVARCSTLGLEVVDAFYVTEADGRRLDSWERRREVEDELLAALA